MASESAPTRFTGRLVGSYVVDVPADPGGAQPWRHAADAPGGGNDRDDAPMGGGWQPTDYTADDAPVLTGESDGQVPTHHGTGSHYGKSGRGRRVPLIASTDGPLKGGHQAATLLTAGASGAAHGGLAATGVSAPWANPGGLDLGTGYTPTAVKHRQGLHFNRPKLRAVAILRAITSRDDAQHPDMLRTAGPVAPHLRRTIRPYGQVDTDQAEAQGGPQAPRQAGPINPGWVM